jgi:N-acetylglucosamine-6-phosphate deacetylase
MIDLAITGGLLPAEFADRPTAGSITEIDGFQPADILSGTGLIAEVGLVELPQDSARLDAAGCSVLPGFLDIHVHGGAGHDTMDADPAGLAAMAGFFTTHGVSSFFPTTMTAPHTDILAAVRAIGKTSSKGWTGARVMGIHLEGPYISPRFPGAQSSDHIRPPDVGAFSELANAGPVKLITLAPERPGGTELMAAAAARDIRIVVGHTDATYDECQAAFRSGASQATHTYNAMSALHHRRPGTLGAVLSNDNVYAQLIADNIHVHPAAMKILARCKGIDRTILITDAIRAAGLKPSTYDLGGQAVTVSDGECRLADGTLAGSVLTMDRALINFMAATGFSLQQAWPATSRTPAEAMGLGNELGQIRPGYRADLVLLDADLSVVATVVGGQVAFLRDPDRLRGHRRNNHPTRAGA